MQTGQQLNTALIPVFLNTPVPLAPQDTWRMGVNVKVRNCTDRPAAEHTAYPSLPEYTYTPCPSGYVENGSKCEGKNLALGLYNLSSC